MIVFQTIQMGKKEANAPNETVLNNKTIKFTRLNDDTMRVTVLLNDKEADEIGKQQWGAKTWGMTIEKIDAQQWGSETWGMKAVTFDIKKDPTKLNKVVPKKM